MKYSQFPGPAYAQNLMAIDFIQGPSYEVVIIGNDTDKVNLILNDIHSFKHDRKVVLYINDNNRNELISMIPFLEAFPKPLDGLPWIYVCKNFSCDLPTQDAEKAKELLNKNN